MSRKYCWLAVLVALTSAAAVAQEMPQYDVMGQCKKQAASIGGGNWIMQACLEQEQREYDALKSGWEAIDGKIKSNCISQTRMVLPSYFMLSACVQQETAAKEAVGQFKFKR